MSEIRSFRGEHRFLSNFHDVSPHSIGVVVGGDIHRVPTSEHAYMACKTTDYEERLAIVLAPTPKDAKRLGYKVTLRSDWDDIKTDVMLHCVRAKFRAPHLAEQLLATGHDILVEGNKWHDNFWGDCSCAKCERTPGLNHLGRILMQVRDEIRSRT